MCSCSTAWGGVWAIASLASPAQPRPPSPPSLRLLHHVLNYHRFRHPTCSGAGLLDARTPEVTCAESSLFWICSSRARSSCFIFVTPVCRRQTKPTRSGSLGDQEATGGRSCQRHYEGPGTLQPHSRLEAVGRISREVKSFSWLKGRAVMARRIPLWLFFLAALRLTDEMPSIAGRVPFLDPGFHRKGTMADYRCGLAFLNPLVAGSGRAATAAPKAALSRIPVLARGSFALPITPVVASSHTIQSFERGHRSRLPAVNVVELSMRGSGREFSGGKGRRGKDKRTVPSVHLA
jgi:hypothetical protein